MLKITYLLFCILNVWLAYNLYRPNFKSTIFMVPSFLAGWLVGELAFFVILFQVIATVVFIQCGAVNGFLANVGLLANFVAIIFYAKFYLATQDTFNVIEDSLRSVLGNDFADDIPESVRKSIPETVSLERLVKPFSLDLPDVECIKNVQYDMQDGMRLKLDIYRKKGEEGSDLKKPVLFQIHGGAWTHRLGSKNEQGRPLMNHLASNGWVCVSVDYRLSPQATFPAHIVDCKKALTWVKENIAEYGGDPEFIAVTGGSAGGHLCSLMGLTENDANFQPGFEDLDTSVQACVPFYGVYDFSDSTGLQVNKALSHFVGKSVMKKKLKEDRDAYEQASPIFRIHKDAPPFMVIQGDSDTLVCGPEAAYFANQLDKVSDNHVCYVELEGAQHAFDVFVSLRSEHCKHGVHKYLSYVHAQHISAKA